MHIKRKALCIALLLLYDQEEVAKKKRVKRGIWVKLQRKAELGIYNNLFHKLLKAKSLRDYIRMDKMFFDYLVERLYPYLIKQDTIMRESIKHKKIVIRKVARIGERVAEAIIEVLQDGYLKTPNTVIKWLEISEKFSQRWNFPNMIGSIDGKPIVLEQPKNSGSHYHNHKGTDSIILMALVGSVYQFLYA